METITAANHEAALKEISDLMDMELCPNGLSLLEEIRLNDLVTAVSAYEEIAHSIGEPTPEAAAAFRAEQENTVHVPAAGEATHVIFYKNVLGRDKQNTGTLVDLRAWAKKEYRANNILAGWEIDPI